MAAPCTLTASAQDRISASPIALSSQHPVPYPNPRPCSSEFASCGPSPCLRTVKDAIQRAWVEGRVLQEKAWRGDPESGAPGELPDHLPDKLAEQYRWYYTYPRGKPPKNTTAFPVPFMSLPAKEILSKRVKGVRRARVLRVLHGLGDDAGDLTDADLDFPDRQRLFTGERTGLEAEDVCW